MANSSGVLLICCAGLSACCPRRQYSDSGERQQVEKEYRELIEGKPPIKGRELYALYNLYSEQTNRFLDELTTSYWPENRDNCRSFAKYWGNSAQLTRTLAQHALINLNTDHDRKYEASFKSSHLFFGGLSAMYFGISSTWSSLRFSDVKDCVSDEDRDRITAKLIPLLKTQKKLIEAFYGIPALGKETKVSDALAKVDEPTSEPLESDRRASQENLGKVLMGAGIGLLAWEFVIPRSLTYLGNVLNFGTGWSRIPNYILVLGTAVWANSPAGRRFLRQRQKMLAAGGSRGVFGDVIDGFLQFRAAPLEGRALGVVMNRYESSTMAQQNIRLGQLHRKMRSLNLDENAVSKTTDKGQ